MRERAVRRVAGLLRARLPELGLDEVPDPRAREGCWSLAQILRATLLGLMAGCRSLAETEALTDTLASGMRRRLGLPRRLADTTARDALCRVPLDGLRAVLHRAVRAAWRRKALTPVCLPFGVVALDGKVTSLPALNHPLVQERHPEIGLPYGLVRTVTCSLVSARGRPCIDAVPVPGESNEVGFFQAAFRSLVVTYGGLFDLVSYDAGGFSRANADAVVAADKHYLFALKDEHRTMCRLADELLATEPVVARTADKLGGGAIVTRSLRLLRADSSWSYGDGKSPDQSVWPHARTFLSIESITARDGEVIARDDRMYVSSLDAGRLSAKQWLLLVRSHWGVENQCHHTLDTAFAEDDRPWIETEPQGMLAVLLLRRVALTLLALYRAVTLRGKRSQPSERSKKQRRRVPWKTLLRALRDTLVAATEEQLAGLRRCEIPAATR